MRALYIAIPLCFVALLAGCERKPEATSDASAEAVPAETKNSEQSSPALLTNAIQFSLKDTTDCGDRCASFQVDWLEFPQQAELNRLVLDQVSAPEAETTKAALSRQGQDFLRDAMEAQEPWEQIFRVHVLPGLGDVSVVEVEAYSYTGGAHGMGTISVINFDRKANRALQLSDVLLPGKEEQFWHIARRAHASWVSQQEDPGTFDGWPFVRTSMFLLSPDALTLQYDPYAIGPYSMGTPAIAISYERLRDVLKPEYLPVR